jgi:hypothetical protein
MLGESKAFSGFAVGDIDAAADVHHLARLSP